MNKDKARNKATDEEIIFPESEVTIDGERITVCEITYMQGMQLHSVIQPMVDDMAREFADDNPGLPVIANIFARHIHAVNDMILLATGKDENWLHSLSDADGQSLLMTFWIVNSDFFTRRLATKSIQDMQAKALTSQKTASGTGASSVN